LHYPPLPGESADDQAIAGNNETVASVVKPAVNMFDSNLWTRVAEARRMLGGREK
jgi:hypothetical protein